MNVLISDNTATQEGGGVFCYNSDPSFVNVTISGNVSAIANGGGFFLKNNASPNLVNTIIRGNASNEIEFASVDDSSSITISYSNIEGGQDSIVTNDNGTVTWGNGNVDIDPMFVDTAIGFVFPVDIMGQMVGIGVFHTIVVLALFLPALAVTVRRLHDTNRRGWWYFILFVPFIGWIWFLVLLCLKETEGENRFGPDPLTE